MGTEEFPDREQTELTQEEDSKDEEEKTREEDSEKDSSTNRFFPPNAHGEIRIKPKDGRIPF